MSYLQNLLDSQKNIASKFDPRISKVITDFIDTQSEIFYKFKQELDFREELVSERAK